MSYSNAVHRLCLFIESLERRRLLAGNVNMVVNASGDLLLTGDNAGNDIEISVRPVDGRYMGAVIGRAGTMIRFRGDTASEQFLNYEA